jgi:Cu2+-exporting ATPase
LVTGSTGILFSPPSGSPHASGWLFWFALGAAVITAIVWTLVGSSTTRSSGTITVLVIACPHALGWRDPRAVSLDFDREGCSSGRAHCKDRLALGMRTVNTVLPLIKD